MGDRRAAALIGSAPLAGALVLLCVLFAAACKSGSSARKRGAREPVARPPVAETTSGLRGDFQRYEVVEIAVEMPSGVTSSPVKRAFREAVYADLIAKGYSPLALEYVDAAPSARAASSRSFQMRSAITEVRRGADGGVLATGWLGLVTRDADGAEVSLFLSEVTELALAPEKGVTRTDGGPATGTRLAKSLLRDFPTR